MGHIKKILSNKIYFSQIADFLCASMGGVTAYPMGNRSDPSQQFHESSSPKRSLTKKTAY